MADGIGAGPAPVECKNCGAPLDYASGEAVLHCTYCGTATMLAGFDEIVRVEAHKVLPVQIARDQVQARTREWLSKGFWKAADLAERAIYEQVEGVALPFWVVKTRARTYWSGMDRRTRTVRRGGTKQSEVYWEPTSGEFADEYHWTVYAREDEDEVWGLAALNPGARSTEADWGKFFLGFGTGSKSSGKSDLLAGTQPFSLEAMAGMRVINGQRTQAQAEQRSETDIGDLHRTQAKGRATRITDCDTSVDMRGCELVYLPVWKVEYRYHSRPYRMLVNGHTGEVIAGQAPVGKWDKVVMLAIVMGVLGLIFAGIALLADAPDFFVGTGATAAAVGLFALWTALTSKG